MNTQLLEKKQAHTPNHQHRSLPTPTLQQPIIRQLYNHLVQTRVYEMGITALWQWPCEPRSMQQSDNNRTDVWRTLSEK